MKICLLNKLVKPTVTDRDIGDLVHYELIGIQREFSINEGIIIFVANHFIEYIIKCVAVESDTTGQLSLSLYILISTLHKDNFVYCPNSHLTYDAWREI